MSTIDEWRVKISLLLSGMVIFGIFTDGNQGVLNISAALLLLFTLYDTVKNRKNIKSGVISFIKNNRIFVLFNLWVIICAVFFTYAQFSQQALLEYAKDWRYVLVLFLFYISNISHRQQAQKTLIVALISTLFFIIFIAPIMMIMRDYDQPLYLQLRYGFAFYIVLLFPFAFSAFFQLKNKITKLLMLILSLSAFIAILYAGSRGGFLSLLIESLVIIFIFSNSYKKFFLYCSSLLVIFISVIMISYHTIGQVKNKVDQTISAQNITSSRDKIISTRYPLIMENIQNNLFGIGYGSVAYNQFLLDHNAKKISGGGGFSERKGHYVYNNDEPFVLNIAYNIGFVGLALFIISLLNNLKTIAYSIREIKNILNISLFSSIIGYFFIYCLFEYVFIEIFLLYTILIFIFLYSRTVEKSR